MFRHKSIILFAAIALMLFMLMGCSNGGDTPVTPSGNQGESAALKDANLEAASGHYCWMSGTIALNPTTGEVFNMPNRDINMHVNVTKYIMPPECWDCMTFPGAFVTQPEDPTKLDWHIKVKLKNPTALEAYEVRAIFFPEACGQYQNENWESWLTIVNYSGFTKVFAGAAGKLHPFINWIIGDFNTRDKFYSMGWSWPTWMVFRVPNQWPASKLLYMNYKIDASFPTPIKESPDIFHEFVTQNGTWYASVVEGYIDIPIWDWQADISQVLVDFTDVSTGFGIGGIVEAEYAWSEYKPADWPVETLHHYYANVAHIATPEHPIADGETQLTVTVVDSVSTFTLVDHIYVNVEFDTDPPTSFSGGDFKGLIDLLNGDHKIRFYYDRAVDPSNVIYIFYYNPVQNAWDNPLNILSTFDCNGITMNYPPGYQACYFEWNLANGVGNWWSVDCWDYPNNKAHTTVQKWGQPNRPVERWHKLAGNIGGQNTNWGSPVLIDMDNDNDDDIIIANRMAAVFCFDGLDGDSPTGLKWSYDTNHSAIYSSPAASDVTGDGIPEVFISTNGVEEGGVFCINGATGFGQWSAVTNDIVDATVCLTDLNGGGDDVVVGDNSGYLYALDGLTGTEIWAEPFEAGAGIGSSAAASDVNNDDIPDISFGAYDGHVYMVDGATGTLIWKYNCGTGLFSVQSSPAMADVSGDGIADVIIGADETVWCFYGPGIGGGQTYALWSNEFNANFRNSPAVGDCNLDGIPDVVITGRQGLSDDLFIINGGNGAGIHDEPGPGGGNIFTSVALADVTDDGHMNVIFGANDPFMADTEHYYIYSCDRLDYGVLLVDMETTLIEDQCEGMPNTMTLGDVNNDGKWDLAFGSVQGRVYVHNLNTAIPTDPALRPWTTFHANAKRDGTPAEE